VTRPLAIYFGFAYLILACMAILSILK